MDKYYTTGFLYIYAWRLQEALPPLNQVVIDVVSALSTWQPKFPIDRFSDPPRKPKKIDRESVSQYINLKDELDPGFSDCAPRLIFMESKDFKISLDITYHDQPQEALRIRYDCASEQPLQSKKESEVLWKVCRAFGAFSGGFGGEPPCARSSILPEEMDYFPGLLRSDRVISRSVPAGIWWINYWDSTQMQTLGVDRVLSAPWAKVQEVEDGAFILAISEEWPHVLDEDYPKRRLEIARHLHLKELYDQYLSGSNSGTP
jgi:hypothetical protein